MSEAIGIGMLGAGNVGGGVVEALQQGAERYAARVGRPLELRRALVRDASRPRPGLATEQLTTDVDDVIGDPGTQIVIELLGGEDPAREYIERALRAGRHVVTANKEVIAKYGAELLAVASRHNVRLLYEASVGGGIPIVQPLRRDLLANDVHTVTAIINGTTNFMLTAMAQDGADYEDVLAEAHRLGYAEPDPTDDVEGIDASYKLAILCGLAFHVAIAPDEVIRQGITTLTASDFTYAAELGHTIKLLATGRLSDGELVASVRPTLIGYGEPLAKVDGVLNAVQVEGDLVGRVLFEGPGAGPRPTAGAVLADVLDVARDLVVGREPLNQITYTAATVRAPDDHESRYYIRMTGANQPGVLAKVATALGEHGINIASVIQFGMEEDAPTEEFVITTYLANGGRLRTALEQIDGFDEVVVGNVLAMAS
ncbi:MAG: homoserine dehydrogenase [Dehalococcoidia bacterium]|jgi:homoserine dehydrogenase|nr:homoserine dehydrogenase [Dehalococcoidia bacterium]